MPAGLRLSEVGQGVESLRPAKGGWREAQKKLKESEPPSEVPPHRESSRGWAHVRQSDLRSLLNRANVVASPEMLQETLRSVEESERAIEFPGWLRA
eukprot:125570-Prymnesium_polylepis.1